jgi:hypothetical protein
MTNFNSNRGPARIIEQIFKLTDEEYLYQFIDQRIEEAAVEFDFDRNAPSTYKSFIGIIGDFVHHIYENGLCIPQTLSVTQARAEAIAILEEYYLGPHARGYYAAFLDTSNSKLDGHESILSQIAEIIKALARERHLKWVYFIRIASLDWITRCQIAEILLTQWRPFLPHNIRQCAPDQFAGHLPDLINLLRSTDNKVKKMLNTDIYPSSPS